MLRAHDFAMVSLKPPVVRLTPAAPAGDEIGLRGQQQTQRDRQRQHPLPYRHMWDDVVHQVRRGLRHAPCAARGAEPAPLAAERQQLVVAALAAAKPQDALRQDAALEKGVELVLDEPGQLGDGATVF